MNLKNFWEWVDDFFGHRVYSATAGDNVGHNWVVADTSAAGTPTFAPVDGSETGEVALDFSSTVEAQNVCLYQGDVLSFDIDKIREVTFRVKGNQAALDATTMLAFGMIGDRNDTIDTIAQAAIFRVVGADDTTAIVVETDDGTTDNNDVATGQSLVAAYKNFMISFALGKADVRFFIDGQPVATGTTFDMSAYTGALQPFVQIQKTSDANEDGVTVDLVEIRGIRQAA